MAKVTIYDMTGKSVGERELNDAIFAVTPNKAVLHEVVKNYLANQRQGTQSTLTRTEVPAAAKSPGARRVPVMPVRVRPVLPSGLTAAWRWAPSPVPTATPSTAR